MDQKKKAMSLSTVIIEGIAAVAWIINCVLNFALGLPGKSLWGLPGAFWWGAQVAGAILLTVFFLVTLCQYRKNPRNNSKEVLP